MDDVAQEVTIARHRVEARMVPHTALTAEALALAHEETEPLRAALAELERAAPERHAILVAYQFDDRRVDEIASSLGIPTNTDWTPLNLTRNALVAAIRRHSARRPI